MKMKILKFIAVYFVVGYLMLTVIPMSFALSSERNKPELGQIQTDDETDLKFLETVSIMSAQINEEEFRLKDEATGEVISVKEREFLFSTLACEMSPEAPDEALKAQVVAANTYYSLIREENASLEYDFTWNSTLPSIYKPKDEIINSWGDKATEFEQKFYSLIDSVKDVTVVYENELACTSYFAVSNGQTLPAQDVWGEDYPYLTSVASPYDILSSAYTSTATVSLEDVKEIALATWPEGVFNFDLPPEQWFSEITYSLGGAVSSINLCGFTMTGGEARDAFSLKSSTFIVEYTENGFLFSTKGYGHGVGMSQTGAMYMAYEGATYIEILNWYYPGTIVE